jgi:hypothetical protein
MNIDTFSTTGKKAIYLFLDEGGDLNFAPNGTRFFTMTCLSSYRPFVLDNDLVELRYNFIEESLDLEYFHASEDRQPTRDKVFATICSHISSFRVDSIIAEKRKTAPSLRTEIRFYPRILGWLIAYVIQGVTKKNPPISDFIIITDQLPIKRKREAVEKAIKNILADKLPIGIHYKLLHHDSKSCCGLQIADYINWAIFRKWERKDSRSYKLIKAAIKSEFDLFRRGVKYWY